MAATMNREVFFDTNVLIYLGSDDPERASKSFELLRGGGVVSVQVLNEYAAVTRGKYRLPWEKVRLGLDGITAVCSVVPLTIELHKTGLSIAERNKFSIYDSMIIAAAQLAGCKVLYSEDMHDGVIDGLAIRNPY